MPLYDHLQDSLIGASNAYADAMDALEADGALDLGQIRRDTVRGARENIADAFRLPDDFRHASRAIGRGAMKGILEAVTNYAGIRAEIAAGNETPELFTGLGDAHAKVEKAYMGLAGVHAYAQGREALEEQGIEMEDEEKETWAAEKAIKEFVSGFAQNA